MENKKTKNKRANAPDRKFMKSIFRPDAFIITTNIFLFVWLLTMIPLNLGFLDPISKALTDFDIYDIYFSKLRVEPEADTSIVIVNIGNLSRDGIARQINNLNKFNPKIIGLDALFEVRRDPQADSMLAAAFAETKNMVLVSRLDNYNETRNSYDSLKTPVDLFNRYAMNGYANLPDDATGSFRTIRNFIPFSNYTGGKVASFVMKIFEQTDKNAFQKFMERGKEFEMINYRGNYDKFYFIDVADCLDENADLSVVRNKIVLMGYLGTDINTKTLEDVFFTPMNEKYAGRTFPDMYGVVIHANILSMMLHGNFINRLPLAFGIMFAFFVGYINALLLLYSKKMIPDWFGGITKLVLFLQALANLIVVVLIFDRYNYRITLTLAIAVVFLVPTSIDIYSNYLEKLYRVITLKYRKGKQ
ncbi:MAG: CHASE2 domain-containing protein [Ignavibacteria bacterium]